MSEYAYTRRDGSLMTWTGRHGDICTHCELVFTGAVAFDRHLRRPQRGGTTTHVDPETVGLESDGTGKWRLPIGRRLDRFAAEAPTATS